MEPKTISEKLEDLLSYIPDCISDLLYYDRKECDEVDREDVDNMIQVGILTPNKLKEVFNQAIDEAFE